MYRQSPSRNNRSKGIKVKNVLQICLLVAVCFWLIYQVKHSHDKKKEFDESDAKALSSDELIRLGRKDIRSGVEETLNKDENHDEASDEEELNGEDVEGNKHEEDEIEDKKVEGKGDDGMGGGDDETDEHEQEKSDSEVDREQDLVDGEEREDGDENEIQNTYSEDGHGQIEKVSTAEDTDHDGDNSTHEAREEHYKADDASSAVTHNTQIETSENDSEHGENSNQHLENILEVENQESNSEETSKSENRKELEVEGGEVAGDGHQSNLTVSETKVDMLDNSANGLSPYNTLTEGSNDHLMSNTTTEVPIEDHDLPSENVTESKPELGHGQGNLTEGVSAGGSDLQTIDLERANDSILNVESTHFDSNSTGSAANTDAELLSVEFSNSSNSTVSSAPENVLISTEAGNNTESSSENNSEMEGEKSDTSDGTDENLETTLSENSEEVQQDAIDISDTSNSMDEKDVRTDLETLPEIQTEGTDNEESAAE